MSTIFFPIQTPGTYNHYKNYMTDVLYGLNTNNSTRGIKTPQGRWVDGWKDSVTGLMTNATNPKLLPVEIGRQLMEGPIREIIDNTPDLADGYNDTLAHYRNHRHEDDDDPPLVRSMKRPAKDTLTNDLTRACAELNTTYDSLMIDLGNDEDSLAARRTQRTSRLN